MTTGKWEHLNRPLGYEIASLLIESALSFSEIKHRLPYENVRDNEVNRILNGQDSGPEMFIVPKTRGGVRHTLDTQLFSDEEIELIQNRAEARISDNQPKTDHSEPSRNSQTEPHVDARNMKSRFS